MQQTDMKTQFTKTWSLEQPREAILPSPINMSQITVQELTKSSSSSRFTVHFEDVAGKRLFSVGSETRALLKEFKSDTLLEDHARLETQQRVLKGLFLDVVEVSGKGKGSDKQRRVFQIGNKDDRSYVIQSFRFLLNLLGGGWQSLLRNFAGVGLRDMLQQCQILKYSLWSSVFLEISLTRLFIFRDARKMSK